MTKIECSCGEEVPVHSRTALGMQGPVWFWAKCQGCKRSGIAPAYDLFKLRFHDEKVYLTTEINE
jgi:hypothetical protein